MNPRKKNLSEITKVPLVYISVNQLITLTVVRAFPLYAISVGVLVVRRDPEDPADAVGVRSRGRGVATGVCRGVRDYRYRTTRARLALGLTLLLGLLLLVSVFRLLSSLVPHDPGKE